MSNMDVSTSCLVRIAKVIVEHRCVRVSLTLRRFNLNLILPVEHVQKNIVLALQLASCTFMQRSCLSMVAVGEFRVCKFCINFEPLSDLLQYFLANKLNHSPVATPLLPTRLAKNLVETFRIQGSRSEGRVSVDTKSTPMTTPIPTMIRSAFRTRNRFSTWVLFLVVVRPWCVSSSLMWVLNCTVFRYGMGIWAVSRRFLVLIFIIVVYSMRGSHMDSNKVDPNRSGLFSIPT